jgi:transcriptional regulator with XRE-family HTH domain
LVFLHQQSFIDVDPRIAKHGEELKAIGQKIRELRMHRGMKLKELSEKVGVTASFLSQVERGVAVPSIGSLKKISDAFGISITSFFGEKDEEKVTHEFSPVVKKNQRKILHPSPGVTYHLLSKNLQGKIEFLIAIYEAGADTGPTPYTHRGEECALVLKGRLEIQIGSSAYTLEKDDSITFSCEIPHRVKNPGKVQAVSIWCITPPSF